MPRCQKVAAVAPSDRLNEVTLESLAELDQRAAEPLLRKLNERFLDSLPKQVAQMCARWAAGETKGALNSAHSLAGASPGVEASAFARATRRISESRSTEMVAEAEAVSRAEVLTLTSWMSLRLPAEAGKSILFA